MKNLKRIFSNPLFLSILGWLFGIGVFIWIWFLSPDAFLAQKIETKNIEAKTKSEIVEQITVEIKETEQKIETQIVPFEIYEKTPYFQLTDYERSVVENIVCGEAGNQPLEGKIAVANCIVNACIKDGLLPSQVRKEYQYSGWKPLEEFKTECMKAYGNTKLADEVSEAVIEVFDNGELLDNNILYFHNPDTSSGSFHKTQQFVFTIGDHDFYKPWS